MGKCICQGWTVRLTFSLPVFTTFQLLFQLFQASVMLLRDRCSSLLSLVGFPTARPLLSRQMRIPFNLRSALLLPLTFNKSLPSPLFAMAARFATASKTAAHHRELVRAMKNNQENQKNFPSVMRPRPQVIFVLGGPGSGKGTQCTFIAEHFGCVHLSAGELLRDAVAEADGRGAGDRDGLGAVIAEHLRAGSIVPVAITIQLLRRAMERAIKAGKSRFFLVDGFPRNMDNLLGWHAMNQQERLPSSSTTTLSSAASNKYRFVLDPALVAQQSRPAGALPSASSSPSPASPVLPVPSSAVVAATDVDSPPPLSAAGDDTTFADVRALLHFDCSQAEMEKRLLKRGLNSGRSDDNAATIAKRFLTFQTNTMPVVQYFEKEQERLQRERHAADEEVDKSEGRAALTSDVEFATALDRAVASVQLASLKRFVGEEPFAVLHVNGGEEPAVVRAKALEQLSPYLECCRIEKTEVLMKYLQSTP